MKRCELEPCGQFDAVGDVTRILSSTPRKNPYTTRIGNQVLDMSIYLYEFSLIYP